MESNLVPKKTTRISFNTKSSIKGENPSVKMKGRKDLQLNMAKIHTPHAVGKVGKFSSGYGKSPVKNIGNATTRNQHINRFNTSNMMVGNSHSSTQYRQSTALSKK